MLTLRLVLSDRRYDRVVRGLALYSLVCISLVIASPAFAATTAPHALMLDPIGTGCVDGGGYDDPFPASKGAMAPPFCMFNPCDHALTRTELSRDIVGWDFETWEWDAYYSRYAEYCRADAVNREGASGPVTAQSFWEPLLSRPLLAYLPGGGTGRDTLRYNPKGRFGGGSITFPVIGGGSLGGGSAGGVSPGGGGSSGGQYIRRQRWRYNTASVDRRGYVTRQRWRNTGNRRWLVSRDRHPSPRHTASAVRPVAAQRSCGRCRSQAENAGIEHADSGVT